MSKEAKKADIALRLKVVREGLWPSCLNCVHWTEVTEITDQERVYFKCGKYNMIPPNETLVLGCIHHEQDIPF